MLRIHLAEAAEVVCAYEVRCSLLHGSNVQLAMLHDVILVLPPLRTESAKMLDLAEWHIYTVLQHLSDSRGLGDGMSERCVRLRNGA